MTEIAKEEARETAERAFSSGYDEGYSEGYDAGLAAGYREGQSDPSHDLLMDSYEEGYEDGLAARDEGALLRALADRAGLDLLEGIFLRWDAAERRFFLSASSTLDAESGR